MRRDLVETLVELHPTFLRFPGGCISEGSYIWDNVYDWKDSVGDVAIRKENFNVWGYMMTLGLGYMEYFQLAEDDAYQQGWKFLTGNLKGGAVVAFTDGEKSFEQEVEWYQTNKDYLDTIVDEHYYRANDYLLENVDRYNYYYRGEEISKVFVGEYASSEKNTLAGAVAEAAVMTGFEQNSDVVRLAATAPLFNKVVKDGTYRWTPDAIWFDNETVWRTPNYYVQQLFAKYIGKSLLGTTYATYENGQKQEMAPTGGILVQVEAKKVDQKQIRCFYQKAGESLQGVLECKLERYNRDIHQAVTMDEEHVYVKLVNADEYAKQTALRLEELDLKEEGEWITLTGDLELAHMSNVNTREKEEIVPKQEKICLKDHQITVKLPAQSVNVLVFERK